MSCQLTTHNCPSFQNFSSPSIFSPHSWVTWAQTSHIQYRSQGNFVLLCATSPADVTNQTKFRNGMCKIKQVHACLICFLSWLKPETGIFLDKEFKQTNKTTTTTKRHLYFNGLNASQLGLIVKLWTDIYFECSLSSSIPQTDNWYLFTCSVQVLEPALHSSKHWKKKAMIVLCKNLRSSQVSQREQVSQK